MRNGTGVQMLTLYLAVWMEPKGIGLKVDRTPRQ